MNDGFLEKRQQLAEFVGVSHLYQYIDHFALYAGTHTIGNKIFTYELLKQTIGVPGDIVEFGTFHGGNLLFLTKMLTLLEPHSPKRVFGFDNFEGLPLPSPEDGDHAVTKVANYKGNEEILRRAISLFDLDSRVQLVVGDALDSISRFRSTHKHSVFSFCYLDFDLYKPTAAALELIDESLSVGGIIAFDEALMAQWPGETLAMKEYLEKTTKQYRMLSNPLSRQPTLALIRES